jgi:hypothetical protein
MGFGLYEADDVAMRQERSKSEDAMLGLGPVEHSP